MMEDKNQVQIEWAHFAAGCREHPDHALDIYRIFAAIQGPLPCKPLPGSVLLMRMIFPLDPAEKYELTFSIQPPKGSAKETDPIELRPLVGATITEWLDNIRMFVPIPIDWMEFTQEGYYCFDLQIDGQSRYQMSLRVRPRLPNLEE